MAQNYDWMPDWSSGGTRIAFARHGLDPFNPTSHIYSMNADGTDPRRVTNSTPYNVYPTWSTDGRYLAFESSDDIYVVNADGSGLRNLTSSSMRENDPDVRPPLYRCTITGTEGDDRGRTALNGTEGDDVICGLAGNDEISGRGGNDRLIGGRGADIIDGGPGADLVDGRQGDDELGGGEGDDVVVGMDADQGTDTVDGGAGTDQCVADAAEAVGGCESSTPPFVLSAPLRPGLTYRVGWPGSYFDEGHHHDGVTVDYATRNDHHAVDVNRHNVVRECGDDVLAPADGTVLTSRETETGGGYGRYVVVDHGGGYTSLYAHLQQRDVVVGQAVRRGELLGLIGEEGTPGACHLHFGLYYDGFSIPPTPMSGIHLDGFGYTTGVLVTGTAVEVTNTSVEEGEAGSIAVKFVVRLLDPSPDTVTVRIGTADGSATAGPDYTALAPTALTFAPGETSKSVVVSVQRDTLFEVDERFYLRLSDVNPVHVALIDGVGIIYDDDLR